MSEFARDGGGRGLGSAEFATIRRTPRRNEGGTTNLIVRGLQEGGRRLRPGFQIVRGRELRPGLNEAIASERMADRFENLGLGEKLEINKVNFEIVGYFEAAGSAAESEVWTDLRDLTGARRTPGALSAVNLRARGDVARQAVIKRVPADEPFQLEACGEPDYFERQMSSAI